MSQNLDKKFRLVQNSHKLLSKSLGFRKEKLHSAAGIPTVQWSGTIVPPSDNENILHKGASIKYVRAEGEGGVKEMTNFCVR